jgi:predicted phosphodiesterase
MNRVLVIGDIHEPASRRGYLEFCAEMREKWKCNRIVFIGDVVDSHAISRHPKHPESPGALDEWEMTIERVSRWKKVFRHAFVCIGNHDERYIRLAMTVSIPYQYMKDYNQIWRTEGWTWDYETIIDSVYYFHGINNGGDHPAYNAMRKMLMSVVMGHNHTAAGIKWLTSPLDRVFGMDVGCGVDDKHLAFEYGRHMKRRSVLGCGVVINGVPYHEIMPIGPGEKYHDGNR